MRIAIAGHFNPVHLGHIQLIKASKKLGNHLTVIVANDRQARKKRHTVFIPEGERLALVYQLKDVDAVALSIDENTDVCDTLRMIKPDIFASGCDESHPDAIREKIVCDELGIEVVYGVGGEKIRSSSIILENYVNTSQST